MRKGYWAHRHRGVPGVNIARAKLFAAIEASETNKAAFLRFLDEKYTESPVRLFLLIFALDRNIEYAVPSSIHEMDPADFLEMLQEKVDFRRLALAMGFTELEIRNKRREAEAASR